ncbi:FMN-binding negative transcriptional regulator [Sphingomonas bacterium]|uniref:FMN-binding negative transcriptional regulator n=1 Tax=Sphingomonas bacterium TaxID=1895847 RepID=UPI0015775B3A|nr:FMN-binding negative transcriptional regulator [Sphingomonas bacterium]
MLGGFEPGDAGEVTDIIRRAPLAWVVSAGLRSSPLPLLAETGPDGSVIALLGHCGRRNPLVAAFAADPRGLVVFMGPQGYVGASLVSKQDWAPSWNYTALRFSVAVTLVPDETLSAVAKLMHAMEGAGGRAMIDRLGPRRDALLGRIVAFRATVVATDHDLKLGQDESTEVFDEIVARHPDRELAAWMARVGRPIRS